MLVTFTEEILNGKLRILCSDLLWSNFRALNVFSILMWTKLTTAWKVSKHGFFSSRYFPAFGLHMERYGGSLRIQSEYEKIRTRKNSVFGHFSYWDILAKSSILNIWQGPTYASAYVITKFSVMIISTIGISELIFKTSIDNRHDSTISICIQDCSTTALNCHAKYYVQWLYLV